MSKKIKYMMTQLSLLIKMSLLGKELTDKTKIKKQITTERLSVWNHFIYFNQSLNIYFRPGMAFLFWWRQFDGLGRISLNTPLQLLGVYEWEMSENTSLVHWNKVGSNFRFTQALRELR